MTTRLPAVGRAQVDPASRGRVQRECPAAHRAPLLNGSLISGRGAGGKSVMCEPSAPLDRSGRYGCADPVCNDQLVERSGPFSVSARCDIRLASDTSGLVANVVTSAMSTIIAKILGERIPSS